jgi:nicotinate-nucleotide adenylyltransferase
LKRIGLFGGTFNPIHNGHLRAAASVRDRFRLDTVVFIPAAIPPHKHSKGVAPAADRLEMVRLATAGLENTVVSDVELVRSGPSFTIDTVRRFRREIDDDTHLFFIMGGDAFLEIDTWKDFQSLFALISMIVLDRPDAQGNVSFFQTVQEFLTSKISDGYLPGDGDLSFSHPHRPTISLFAGELIEMSSTLIRQRIGRGESVSDDLPGSVESYIRRKGLYL